MSQDVTNPIQSLSYTNKDFQSIYEELLDLVKQLTYKWDPSISNESDPGVVLLKLNAIIADKCNYNIDKNVLECFPLSVTQETNARQLFEQLGYYMHWYKGATTPVTLRWISDTQEASYTIPAFTMVSDTDNELIYTLIGPYLSTTSFDVSSQTLTCDGSALVFRAIQGTAVEYDINGDTLITPSYLDSNNRLYFTTSDIAENGIFITNSGLNNYSDWVKKDNLIVESLGNTYYKFGVTSDTNTCYIEFPEDAETLFKDGIYITYIRTDGASGNIPAMYLEKFYNDITPVEDSSITLTTDYVSVNNYASAVDGTDKETINDAYKGYKRVSGTFDTLVTLRDYINAIVTSGLVSNGFVCDRTNDIQNTYKVMTTIDGIDQKLTKVEQDRSGNPLLTAFSLKMYLLNYATTTRTSIAYNTTFSMLNNDNQALVKAYIEDTKSLQHDYVDISSPNGLYAELYDSTAIYHKGDFAVYQDKLYKAKQDILVAEAWNSAHWEESSNASHFCLFKNKYPINATIIPQYQLTTTQASEVQSNIKIALFNALNAKQIEFGDEIDIDLVYDAITGADERIKSVILDNINYTTYAVYLDDGILREQEISTEDEAPVDTTVEYSSSEYSETSTYSVGAYVMYDEERYRCTTAVTTPEEFDSNKWTLDEITVVVDEDTFTSKIGYGKYFPYTFIYDGTNWKVNLIATAVTLASYGITISGTALSGDRIVVGLSLKTQFRDEIYAKSVLAGATPLLVKDEEFDYQLNQHIRDYDRYSTYNIGDLVVYNNLLYKCIVTITVPETWNSLHWTRTDTNTIENIESLATNVDINYRKGVSGLTDVTEYKLRSNENLQFYAPNLIDATSYSNYVKYEYYITHDVTANSDYELDTNEYILFYWREDDSTDSIYKYYAYGEGIIINSTFAMPAKTSQSGIVGASLIQGLRNIGTEQYPKKVADSSYNGDMSDTISEAVSELTSLSNVLSGTKQINIRDINKITLDKAYSCYWILSDNDDDETYVLFEDDPIHPTASQSRILNANEYFIYSANPDSELVILGSGTEISRSNSVGTWSVEQIEATEVTSEGVTALVGLWHTIPSDTTVTVVENQYTTLGPGCTVKIEASNLKEVYTLTSRFVGTNPLTITVDKDVWYASPAKYQVGIFDFTYSVDHWVSDNVTVDIADYGITLSGTPVTGDAIRITVTETWTIKFDREGSTCSKDLKYFTISYKTSDDGEYVQLEDIALVSHTGWEGRSLLNISASTSTEQILLDNQSITYYQVGSTSPYTLYGKTNYTLYQYNCDGTESGSYKLTVDGVTYTFTMPTVTSGDRLIFNPNNLTKGMWVNYIGNNEVTVTVGTTGTDLTSYFIPSDRYPICLLATISVDTNGGGFVSTYDIDDQGVYSYEKFYIFEKLLDNEASALYASDGTVSVNFEVGENTKSLRFVVPVGEYILPLDNQVEDLIALSVSLDGTALHPIYDTSTQLASIKNYPLYMNISTLKTHELTITVGNHLEAISVTLGNPVKYTKPSTVSTAYFNKIMALLSQLDNQSHNFTYTYEIDEDNVIEDPLNAKSFFKDTHIYKQFTISQLDTSSNTTIYITGKKS